MDLKVVNKDRVEHIRSSDPREIVRRRRSRPFWNCMRTATKGGVCPPPAWTGLQRGGRLVCGDRRGPPLPPRLAPGGESRTRCRLAPIVETRGRTGIDFVALPVAARDGTDARLRPPSLVATGTLAAGQADFASRPSTTRLKGALMSLARLHLAMASFDTGGRRSDLVRLGRSAGAGRLERLERLAAWTDAAARPAAA